ARVRVGDSAGQEVMGRGGRTGWRARGRRDRQRGSRARGAGRESGPGCWRSPGETGDRMRVCSDGLSGEVDDAAIEQMLRSPADVRTVCSDLVRRALDAGGHDNVSVVVVEAVEVV